MALIKGTFGRYDAVYDGANAPTPVVPGVFGLWREVFSEGSGGSGTSPWYTYAQQQ